LRSSEVDHPRAAGPLAALGVLLACIAAAAPQAQAANAPVVSSDEEMTLHLDAWVQTQIEHADAAGPAGEIQDPFYGRDGQSDEADAEIRRAHLELDGSYYAIYRFAVVVAADGAGGQDGSSSRTASLYQAWVDRDFTLGGETHTLHLGLDYPFFNRAYGGSPYDLLPEARPSGALLGFKGVGARYRVSGDQFDFGVDVQNNLGGGKPAANAGERGGLCYSARFELDLAKGSKPAYRESYAGKNGEGLILAGDVAYDDHDTGTAGSVTTGFGYGVEALGHLDAISVLAEARWAIITVIPDTGSSLERHQSVLLVQGGYAFPLGSGMALEPAMRTSWMNFDTGTGAVPYDDASDPDSDWGSTGVEYDFGVNLYLDQHTNKLQLSYSHWQAAVGQGHADIWRFQHQLTF
jgi:hypothetical protein